MQTFAQNQNQSQNRVTSRSTQSNTVTSELTHHTNHIPHLQHTIGNQAVEQLSQTNSAGFKGNSTSTESPRLGHDFSQISVYAKGSEKSFPTTLAFGKNLQDNPDNKHNIHIGSSVGLASSIGSSGHMLEPAIRLWFEHRIGQDLGDIRIHRGPQVDKATRNHGALAATLGSDIAISSAVGGPNTSQGLFVLAHELIHVAQQKDVSGPVSQNQDLAAEYQAHALTPSLLVPGSQPLIHRVAHPSVMFLTDASGQHSKSTAGGITADLTSPIVVGRVVQFQVEIAPNLSYSPATKLVAPYPHYLWEVFDKDTNAKVAEDWSPTNTKAISYPRAGHFRVQCTFVDPSKGVTPAITLDQDVVNEDPTLAGSLSSDSDYSEAERELVDDFRSYVNDAAASTGAQGITPRFLASILREEIANTDPSLLPSWLRGTIKSARATEISDVDTAIKKQASGATVPMKDINRSIGVGQMKLSTAAMLQGLIPWIEQDPQNKQPARTQINTEFSKLPTTTLTDLHTLLAWPKSNIKMVAELLAKLKNRANRYPLMTRAAFGTHQRACEIIATEYNVGATNSPEPLANASDYGRRIWSYMSLPLMQKFFSNN
ncbi:MAG: DUF4157 domain-containing protein [Acidobacteriota bacterium]